MDSGVNGGVNGGVNEGLKYLLETIIKHLGIIGSLLNLDQLIWQTAFLKLLHKAYQID